MGGLIAKIITKRIILKSHSQSAKCMDHHSWRLFLGIEPQPQNSLCASQPSPESNWILFLVLTRTANSFSVHCITVLLSNVFKCIISPEIQALTGSLPTPRYRGANSRETSTHFPRQKSGYHLPSVGAPLQVWHWVCWQLFSSKTGHLRRAVPWRWGDIRKKKIQITKSKFQNHLS